MKRVMFLVILSFLVGCTTFDVDFSADVRGLGNDTLSSLENSSNYSKHIERNESFSNRSFEFGGFNFTVDNGSFDYTLDVNVTHYNYSERRPGLFIFNIPEQPTQGFDQNAFLHSLQGFMSNFISQVVKTDVVSCATNYDCGFSESCLNLYCTKLVCGSGQSPKNHSCVDL